MPSRHRPKAPPPPPPSDAERFAEAIRDHEEADRRAQQAKLDRKAESERRKIEAVEFAARLEHARAAHKRAVQLVKEAQRSGRGAAAADVVWRAAKAELIELETGERPAWAAKPESSAAADEPDEPSDDE